MLSFSQSSPSYDIVCPGDTLVFTCITSYQGGTVAWRIDNTNRVLTDVNSKLLNGFIIKITNINYNTAATVVSTATKGSVQSQLNGTVIDCTGDGVSYNTLTVHIAGKIHHEP